MSNPTSNLISSTGHSVAHAHDHLINLIAPKVASLGYQVVHLEVHSHRQKVLRLYIDYLEPSSDKMIGIEDCVRVSRELDEFLDQVPEVEAAFHGTYEFEVSSPGVDRPLRTVSDFERFRGRLIRIHVYRPLTNEELGNKDYQEKNPRQKNFLGLLQGFQEGKIVLSVAPSDRLGGQKLRSDKKGKTKKKTQLIADQDERAQVAIPLSLVSKANLEPEFDFEESMKESKEL